jgi:hypothetical protein
VYTLVDMQITGLQKMLELILLLLERHPDATLQVLDVAASIARGIAETLLVIFLFRSSKVRGVCLNTLPFRRPHRKKCRRLKFGDRAGLIFSR